jgi:hypothetical protein
MLRKLIIGLVAAASLSTIALAPTAASAGGFHGGWHGGWGYHHHYFGGGIRFIGGGLDEGCYVTRPVRTPFGYRLRTVNVCGY